MARPTVKARIRPGSLLAAFLFALLPGMGAADDFEGGISATADLSRHTAQERPFAFSQDPTTPSAGVFSAGFAFGVGSGISADRPLPVNLATASGSSTFSVAFGATDRIAPYLSATFADVGTSSPAKSYAAGATWQVTNPNARLRASITAAGLHEGESGANGITSLIAASLDQGALKLAANVRADKVFAKGRDAMDYLVTLGAGWRLAEWVRLGAEYVGQDLEETFTDGAEGGSRHAVGPTLALDLDGGRYQVAVGSGFGLTAKSPRAMARAVVGFSF
jgi:hypothetical protein